MLISAVASLLQITYGVISAVHVQLIYAVPVIFIVLSVITASTIWPVEKLTKIVSNKIDFSPRFNVKLISTSITFVLIVFFSFSNITFFLAERVLSHTQLCEINRACVGWVHYATFQDHDDYQGVGSPIYGDLSFSRNPESLQEACPARIDPARSVTLRESIAVSYWAPAQIDQSVDDALQFTPSPQNITQNICTDEQDTSCQTVLREVQLEEGDRVRILGCARLPLNNSEYELWVQIRDQNFNEWRHQNDG